MNYDYREQYEASVNSGFTLLAIIKHGVMTEYLYNSSRYELQ